MLACSNRGATSVHALPFQPHCASSGIEHDQPNERSVEHPCPTDPLRKPVRLPAPAQRRSSRLLPGSQVGHLFSERQTCRTPHNQIPRN
jgi:hypothetical protein